MKSSVDRFAPPLSSRLPLNVSTFLFSTVLLVSAASAQERAKPESPREPSIEANPAERKVIKLIDSGRAGVLEAELVLLMREDYPSIAARKRALDSWYQENGESLKAEQAQLTAQQRNTLSVRDRDSVLQKQRRQIEVMVEDERSGEKEAELVELIRREFSNATERKRALSQWHSENEAALRRDRSAVAANQAAVETPVSRRARQRADAILTNRVLEGEIDPRDAELVRLMRAEYPNAKARQEAIRWWHQQVARKQVEGESTTIDPATSGNLRP
ncbi:MAG: hypothetical protein AAF591_04145 [Verrucomicrobiota bacterium]